MSLEISWQLPCVHLTGCQQKMSIPILVTSSQWRSLAFTVKQLKLHISLKNSQWRHADRRSIRKCITPLVGTWLLEVACFSLAETGHREIPASCGCFAHWQIGTHKIKLCLMKQATFYSIAKKFTLKENGFVVCVSLFQVSLQFGV